MKRNQQTVQPDDAGILLTRTTALRGASLDPDVRMREDATTSRTLTIQNVWGSGEPERGGVR